MTLKKELAFLSVVTMEIGKSNFSLIIATVAMSKESVIKNLNLIDLNYH